MQSRSKSIPRFVSEAAIALASFDEDKWKRAINTLAESNVPSAQAALIDALTDSRRSVRFEVAFTLASLKDEHAIPVLIEALKEQYRPNELRGILENLGELAGNSLITVVCDEKEAVRKDAVFILGEIKYEPALPSLLKALSDESQQVRGLAARAIGQINNKEIVPQLLDALEQDDPQLKAAAADALGRLREASTAPALIRCLEDYRKADHDYKQDYFGGLSHPQVSNSAEHALYSIGTSKAVSAIEAFHQKRNKAIEEMIEEHNN